MRKICGLWCVVLAGLSTGCNPDTVDAVGRETGSTGTGSTGTGSTGTEDTGTGSTGTEDSGTESTETGGEAPDASELSLSFSPTKQFDFKWTQSAGAEFYRLLEQDGGDYVQVGADTVETTMSRTTALHLKLGANYRVRACNDFGCTDSEGVVVAQTMVEAIGYVKASNTGEEDRFGYDVALSGDGNTLAVGANSEDSSATGIGGDEQDNSVSGAGAVYVYTREGETWSQEAYVKASNPGEGDSFGHRVALSEDGNTLAVGADSEGSSATGIGGDEQDNSESGAGAVYVYVREAGAWSQEAYVKASNTGEGDGFGRNVALSADGNTLAVAAAFEDSSATGIGGDEQDNSVSGAGAVYVYAREGEAWSQEAYVKASNTGEGDAFGVGMALSADGATLAVGAAFEDSSATGIGADEDDDAGSNSGAVYVYVREGEAWSQEAYVKASNTGQSDSFGYGVALSAGGNTLAVGANSEGSGATGIGGDEQDDSESYAGAVYVYVREGEAWSQEAYVKASNNGEGHPFGDAFGIAVALSEDGNMLAVGAYSEDSNAVGIGGAEQSESAVDAGAVYVYIREGEVWNQEAYVKASNTGGADRFGHCVALSADGNTLAVGAHEEDSEATGLNDDATSNTAAEAGGVYLY